MQTGAQMSLLSLLVICWALCLSPLQVIPTAHAQDQSIAPGPDKIRAMLLRPWGWIVEWGGQWGPGEAGFLYEARGEKVVVIIENFTNPGWNCEREVTITAEGFRHDGCRDNDVIFRVDPTDPAYPFKGKGRLGIDYRFRAK